MSRLIQLVADYGQGDPAFREVNQRLLSLLGEATVLSTAVPAFDTLATGFWIYQYGMGEHPEGMVVYSNTAPRKDKKEKREQNEGEKLMYGKLSNGVEIMAVNSGWSFSFVKPHLTEFRVVKIENKGSQFRSRDFYPKAVAALIKGKEILGEAIEVSTIPEVLENRIAWIDGYGNIKTTIRKSRVQFEPGSKVKVSINGINRTALVAGGNFHVAEGELSFSPGSSGYEDPFMELFLRGGSAEQLFDYPRTSAPIKFK